MNLETQFDGLVGPTHHYAGQSFGNQASMQNAQSISNPRAAALQGIKKAAFVRGLGIPQAMFPPLRRPRIDALHRFGYRGTETQMIERAYRDSPKLVSAIYSASSMWVANSGTFSPSRDCQDGKAHFTAANLSSKLHRSLEAPLTSSMLKQVFRGTRFVHHDPVDSSLGDEGAANHGRLSKRHGDAGVELFFYGREVLGSSSQDPKKYPPRQALEASQVIARNHGLRGDHALFLRQSRDAIDAGVFHNDVISVTNENVYLCHEKTFEDSSESARLIREVCARESIPLEWLEVRESELSLAEVVSSYLFNSQLLTLPNGDMALIAPEECRENSRVKSVIDGLIGRSSRLRSAHFFDLKESMRNGGGPACLRLRVALTDDERADVLPGVWLTPEQEALLQEIVQARYRDRLVMDDLKDPHFYRETQETLDRFEVAFGLKLI